jgi:glycerol-3-phosphate acyltransferase PlsY
MSNFIWVVISYVLGSIPFGYIVTRLSTGKNILEIGWRKTSGSNVFKNVGKWQGALSGLLDVLKGYLAVFIAQKLGFSSGIQVLSGVAAVCGHNWSIFIKFAGGRGIGTFVGAFLPLAPRILGYSIIPFILIAIVWNGSIGTLSFFIISIYLSVRFSQFETVGIFSILVLIPVLIKRLSPIREIFQAKEKGALVRNRLLFDNDQFLSDLRIKRIFKRLSWW